MKACVVLVLLAACTTEAYWWAGSDENQYTVLETCKPIYGTIADPTVGCGKYGVNIEECKGEDCELDERFQLGGGCDLPTPLSCYGETQMACGYYGASTLTCATLQANAADPKGKYKMTTLTDPAAVLSAAPFLSLESDDMASTTKFAYVVVSSPINAPSSNNAFLPSASGTYCLSYSHELQIGTALVVMKFPVEFSVIGEAERVLRIYSDIWGRHGHHRGRRGAHRRRGHSSSGIHGAINTHIGTTAPSGFSVVANQFECAEAFHAVFVMIPKETTAPIAFSTGRLMDIKVTEGNCPPGSNPNIIH